MSIALQNVDGPRGVLRPGWSAEVGDYAIAGGWTVRGEVLVVGDAAGGVYAFDGKSGATIWVQRGVHAGGVLAAAVHPDKPAFATAGQDGRVLVWGVASEWPNRPRIVWVAENIVERFRRIISLN